MLDAHVLHSAFLISVEYGSYLNSDLASAFPCMHLWPLSVSSSDRHHGLGDILT